MHPPETTISLPLANLHPHDISPLGIRAALIDTDFQVDNVLPEPVRGLDYISQPVWRPEPFAGHYRDERRVLGFPLDVGRVVLLHPRAEGGEVPREVGGVVCADEQLAYGLGCGVLDEVVEAFVGDGPARDEGEIPWGLRRVGEDSAVQL